MCLGPVTCSRGQRNNPKLIKIHHNSKQSLNGIGCVFNVPEAGCMCLGPVTCSIGWRNGK